MVVSEFLTECTGRLVAAGISTARLDCLVLLEHTLRKDRANLLAHPEVALLPEQEHTLRGMVKRRSEHEPLAYIRGESEFYGRPFFVDKRVLVPRPETERIIELLIRSPLPHAPCIADIGTGSGVLAVTAALELPSSHVIATDIDPDCLDVASKNAHRYRVAVMLLQGDLGVALSDSRQPPNVLLCNLPYVPLGHPINPAAAYEPHKALYGGEDGLDLYRRLFEQIKHMSRPPRIVIAESMPSQHPDLSKIAVASGYRPQADQEFAQLYVAG